MYIDHVLHIIIRISYPVRACLSAKPCEDQMLTLFWCLPLSLNTCSICVIPAEELHSFFPLVLLSSYNTFYLFIATHSAQLVFLRNRLWSELLQLFSALLSGKQGFETIRDALLHCGPWRYFSTLMVAIENELSTKLRHSALTCLTSLLSHEVRTRSLSEETCLVQNLLDSYFPVPEEENHHTTQYKLLKHLVLPLQRARSDHNATVCHNKPLVYSKHSNKDDRNMAEPDEHMLLLSKQKKVSQSQAAANKSKCESSRRKTYQKDNSVDHVFSSDEHKQKLFSNANALPSVRTEPEGVIAKKWTVGAELCNLLLHEYEIHKLMLGSAGQRSGTKGRMLVTCALSSLLAVSQEAKKVGLKQGLLETLVIQLRELHVKLSLESAESLRRISDKKRVRGHICLFEMLDNLTLLKVVKI
jgi:hypothetical protein